MSCDVKNEWWNAGAAWRNILEKRVTYYGKESQYTTSKFVTPVQECQGTHWQLCIYFYTKKARENLRERHNHKLQPFPDTKGKRKQTKPNKHKSNKRTKSTKTSSLFPKRGNRNAERSEKHNNKIKITQGKTLNISPRRINHKATKSKTNTGITALEWSVEQTTGIFTADQLHPGSRGYS